MYKGLVHLNFYFELEGVKSFKPTRGKMYKGLSIFNPATVLLLEKSIIIDWNQVRRARVLLSRIIASLLWSLNSSS